MSHRFRATSRRGPRSPRTALVVDVGSGRLMTSRIRPWTRLVSHLLADRLDRQLASGTLPESSRLLAVRAQYLVSPARCLALAVSWELIVRQAHFSSTGPGHRLPLCHDRIKAAEADIRAMVGCLADPTPSAARGIAMLTILLRRGDGPLFNRGCPDNLSQQMQQAIEALDPINSLQSWV